MKFIRSEIIGHGHYAPAKVLTNDDMAKIVETSDEWITTRTGIKSRHIVENELNSDLSYQAAKMALKTAGISAEELDVVILATVTPDNTTPATAIKVATMLGAKPGTPAMDVSAACSGFVYALTVADNMIRLGQAKTALVIGAETLSRITDWTDRNTCVLFGDGAGAVILRAREGNGDSQDTGILSTKIYSDGSHYDTLRTTGGVSSTQTAGFVTMDGKEVFKYAINSLAQAAEETMKIADVKIEEIDWLLPHQANIRIIEGVGKKLELPEEKVVVNLADHGNTSAASIPLALSEKMAAGVIKKGDLVVLTAMGAGFTWGGAVVRL
ncbi:MAG: ketoacyl-ACP synthase III [Alphaproteobacteria bacterium]|nr:ketoacyl-ACP synthase III [Alphaproteobacteria bacterium]